MGDELRLEQILLNLVGNAVKFTETGYVRVAATCEAAGTGGGWLRIEVVDSGIGIAADVLDGLFESFQQADAGITRRYGGTGLGLSISRNLAELMGGRLTAESRPGRGSRFLFEAVFDLAPATPPEPRRPEPAAQGPRLDGLRLLVVDDSAVSRDVAVSMLQLEGASADARANGLEALEALRAEPDGYDAVLMDMHMPEMDGITATLHVRQELGLADLPIIALTAGLLDAKRAAAMGVGVTAIVTKPVDLEALVRQIRGCLALPIAAPEPTEQPADGAEFLPDLAGVDAERARCSSGGSRIVFLRLLGLFTVEFADVAETMRRHLAGGDMAAAARLMHTLKGSAATLGADEIAAAAAAVEAAVLRGEAPADDLPVALARAMEALVAAAARLGATVDDPAPDAARVPTAEQMAELTQALQSHDLEALCLFDRLDAGLHLLLGDAQAADLRSAVTRLRFDEALAILE
ncbi:MAG: ATP-binding protein [Armatimonadetes bacterium]|nr:ATP-binding protein [Armatimonadota bacterium]